MSLLSILPTTGRGGMMTTLHRLRRRISVDQRLFLVFIVFISVFIVQSENSHLASKSEEPDHHQSAVMASKGLPQPIHLPSNFDAQLEQDGVILKKERQQQWHGDHGTVEESGRGFGQRAGRQGRLLWPFTIEVTKGKAGDHKHHHTHGGWGGPNKFGSFWPFKKGIKVYNTHREHGIHFKAGSHKPDHHDHHDHGWGWEAQIEKEKHKLRYEILKLKAKKNIALLQNAVELKKLFSIILQKIVQALEWWR